jgi:hypothetical protein
MEEAEDGVVATSVTAAKEVAGVVGVGLRTEMKGSGDRIVGVSGEDAGRLDVRIGGGGRLISSSVAGYSRTAVSGTELLVNGPAGRTGVGNDIGLRSGLERYCEVVVSGRGRT